MAKHHPDLIMCRKQPGIAIGRLCEKCDGKCVVCDSYVRPCTLVRICDECNYGSYQVCYPALLLKGGLPLVLSMVICLCLLCFSLQMQQPPGTLTEKLVQYTVCTLDVSCKEYTSPRTPKERRDQRALDTCASGREATLASCTAVLHGLQAASSSWLAMEHY